VSTTRHSRVLPYFLAARSTSWTWAPVLEDGVLYHTYSAYARRVERPLAHGQWLNRAARGSNVM